MSKIVKEKKVKKSTPEPHWNELVEVYFSFCRQHFDETPSFDGSAPRDLKSIIKSLRERAEKLSLYWDLDTARFRLHKFLEFAIKDNWLKNNWLLFNINRQKDKIFFNIRKSILQTPTNPFE